MNSQKKGFFIDFFHLYINIKYTETGRNDFLHTYKLITTPRGKVEKGAINEDTGRKFS